MALQIWFNSSTVAPSAPNAGHPVPSNFQYLRSSHSDAESWSKFRSTQLKISIRVKIKQLRPQVPVIASLLKKTLYFIILHPIPTSNIHPIYGPRWRSPSNLRRLRQQGANLAQIQDVLLVPHDFRQFPGHLLHISVTHESHPGVLRKRASLRNSEASFLHTAVASQRETRSTAGPHRGSASSAAGGRQWDLPSSARPSSDGWFKYHEL